MKENWQYKKLGEVCEIYQPKTLATEQLVVDGKYNVYGANGVIGKYDKYNHEQSEILLTCRGATCGTINVSEPFSWINGNAMVIHRKSEELSFDFLKYLMLSLDYSLIITGAAQPQITRQKLSPTPIKFPPLSTQKSIVAELDEINNLLSLKRKELETYDKLSQSVFYEMFGDPVDNEKGWEVKKWQDVLTIINGKNQKAVEKENGEFPIYGSGGIMSYASDWLCPENCTIIGRKGNINKPIFVKTKFWNVDTAFGLNSNKEVLAPLYLYYFCTNYNFEKHNKAVTIPSLTKSDLLRIDIPLPPLSLQETFAKKIEAIEKQKNLIKIQIEKLETLLASRMQFWFE